MCSLGYEMIQPQKICTKVTTADKCLCFGSKGQCVSELQCKCSEWMYHRFEDKLGLIY